MDKIRRCIFSIFVGLCLLFCPAQALAAQYYISAEGDSLAELAAASGVDTELLKAANDLSGDSLAAGSLLVLPLEPLQAVTIQAGDTLWSVSQAHGVSVDAVLACNERLDARRLYPGMTVYVPLPEEQAALAGPAEAAYPAVAALASRGAKLIWPAEGVISSRYGPRGSGYHYGLDIAADSGSAIRAALSGTVIEAGWKNDAYGYAVLLEHDNGLKTVYGHAASVLVRQGKQVRQGDTIALVGSTGNSTGPHLHFEVRVNDLCVDPLEYLR